MPRHDARDLPQSHRLGAIKEGFVEFSSPVDATFTFLGHRVHQILLNGIVFYTFVHDSSGVLQTITNNPRGNIRTLSYNIDGTILSVTSDDAA